MNTKRFGPKDENGIAAVDVNLDAFKDVKSIDELKKEPGRIFEHLSSADENAAYEELAAELGLTKAAAQNATPKQTATAPAPIQ